MYKNRGIIALVGIVFIIIVFLILNSISTALAVWVAYAIISLFLVGFSIYLFVDGDYDKFKIAGYSILLIIMGFYIAKFVIWLANAFH